MLSKKGSVILSLLFILLINVCQASELKIEKITDEISFKSGITYNSFWDALHNLCFTSINQNNYPISEDQKSIFYIYQFLMDGNFSEAEKGLNNLILSAIDSEVKRRSQYILLQLWFYQSDWNKLIDAKENWNIEISPGLNQLFSWAEAYSKHPLGNYVFRSEVVLPLKFISFTGHPSIEVSVCGKKYRFIIDTGAPITVISSRVAKESGIQPTGSVIIGTSTDRKQATDTQMATV